MPKTCPSPTNLLTPWSMWRPRISTRSFLVFSPKWRACWPREDISCTPISPAARSRGVGRRTGRHSDAAGFARVIDEKVLLGNKVNAPRNHELISRHGATMRRGFTRYASDVTDWAFNGALQRGEFTYRVYCFATPAAGVYAALRPPIRRRAGNRALPRYWRAVRPSTEFIASSRIERRSSPGSEGDRDDVRQSCSPTTGIGPVP